MTNKKTEAKAESNVPHDGPLAHRLGKRLKKSDLPTFVEGDIVAIKRFKQKEDEPGPEVSVVQCLVTQVVNNDEGPGLMQAKCLNVDIPPELGGNYIMGNMVVGQEYPWSLCTAYVYERFYDVELLGKVGEEIAKIEAADKK